MFDPSRPLAIDVAFPSWNDYESEDCPTRDYYVVRVNIEDASVVEDGFPGTKRITVALPAQFTSESAIVPDNLTEINAMASGIAREYARWTMRDRDMRFVGITDWAPDGTTDWVHFDMRMNEAGTRVTSAGGWATEEVLQVGCLFRKHEQVDPFEPLVRGAARRDEGGVFLDFPWNRIGGLPDTVSICSKGEDSVRLCCQDCEFCIRLLRFCDCTPLSGLTITRRNADTMAIIDTKTTDANGEVCYTLGTGSASYVLEWSDGPDCPGQIAYSDTGGAAPGCNVTATYYLCCTKVTIEASAPAGVFPPGGARVRLGGNSPALNTSLSPCAAVRPEDQGDFVKDRWFFRPTSPVTADDPFEATPFDPPLPPPSWGYGIYDLTPDGGGNYSREFIFNYAIADRGPYRIGTILTDPGYQDCPEGSISEDCDHEICIALDPHLNPTACDGILYAEVYADYTVDEILAGDDRLISRCKSEIVRCGTDVTISFALAYADPAIYLRNGCTNCGCPQPGPANRGWGPKSINLTLTDLSGVVGEAICGTPTKLARYTVGSAQLYEGQYPPLGSQFIRPYGVITAADAANPAPWIRTPSGMPRTPACGLVQYSGNLPIEPGGGAIGRPRKPFGSNLTWTWSPAGGPATDTPYVDPINFNEYCPEHRTGLHDEVDSLGCWPMFLSLDGTPITLTSTVVNLWESSCLAINDDFGLQYYLEDYHIYEWFPGITFPQTVAAWRECRKAARWAGENATFRSAKIALDYRGGGGLVHPNQVGWVSFQAWTVNDCGVTPGGYSYSVLVPIERHPTGLTDPCVMPTSRLIGYGCPIQMDVDP